MSWLERVKKDLIIETGDGKKFIPDWMNAESDREYQVAEFDFPEVEGTFVDRRLKRGTKYNLEIFFQGDDHLDKAKEFLLSADDPRFWTISHPFYDIINVQPLSIKTDNRKYNVSKLIIPIIETITDVNPKTVVIIEDKVEEDAEAIDLANSIKFENDVTPSSSDINTMTDVVDNLSSNTLPLIQLDEDGQNFINAVNDAKTKILGAVNFAKEAMSGIQDVVNAASLLNQNLNSRITIIKRNATNYRNIILGTFQDLQNMPNSNKLLIETIGGSIVASLALAASKIFDENDYNSRIKVIEVIEVLLETYDGYVADLDEMQSGSGGNPNDYVASGEGILNLNILVNFTMSNLFDLALTSRQERIFLLENDSDLVTLSHRLYGLNSDDSTINELERNNEFGLNGILNIKKGTEITYYI